MPERISVPNPEELAQRLGTLTTREIEVLTLIGEGLTYAEIAQRMKRSRKTIETHRLFIGRKLGVSKQVVLARIAIQAGFVSVPGARITAPAAPADLRAELARRKKSQEALRRIDIATTSVAGDAFLHALVTELARTLDVRLAAIAEVNTGGGDEAHIVAAVQDGQPVGPLSLRLSDSPWRQMPATRSRLIRKDLLAHYPNDPLAGLIEARSGAGCVLCDAQGDTIGFLCVMHDGKLDESYEPELLLRLFAGRAAAELERLHGERQLAESEARYRLLADHSADMICRHALDGSYLYVSPASRDLVGYEPRELLGRSPYEFLHPDDVKVVASVHGALRDTPDKARVRCRYRRKDGNYTWLETDVRSVTESGGLISFVTSSRDVSEQQHAAAELQRANEELESRVAQRTAELTKTVTALTESREELRRNEERWRTLVRDANDFIMVVDRDMIVQYLNRVHHDVRREDIIGYRLLDTVVPEDQERFRTLFEQVITTGESGVGEFASETPAGRRLWESRFGPITVDGQIVGVGIIASDITSRRASENALRESEARYRHLINIAPDGILVHDGEYIRFANPALAAMVGADCPEQLFGRRVLDIVHADYHAHVRERIALILKEGQPVSRIRMEIIRLDGSPMAVETAGTVFEANGQRMVQVILRDITTEVSPLTFLRERWG